MRVLVIENFAATPPGLVGVALAEAGARIDLRRAFLGEPVPVDHRDHDALVILGGAQNALDDEGSPWLPTTAALSRAFGEADKAVLGICLGAQLVARGHGGENILGRPVEFGWQEVRPTDHGAKDPLISRLDGGSPLFHWHEDTFTLPPGARHLALSDMTANQAFRIGRAVYGIQFHFEADSGLVEDWTRDLHDQIVPHRPAWREEHPLEAARHASRADAAGMAIARAWVSLI